MICQKCHQEELIPGDPWCLSDGRRWHLTCRIQDLGGLTEFLQQHENEILRLQARVLEYEHALEHIAEAHEPQCPDCRRLAQSALDGVNRDMCLDMAFDFIIGGDDGIDEIEILDEDDDSLLD